jgi:hypothetical protein
MLIIHIGLPKTGTTFLQKEVFKHLPGVFYIHRSQGSVSKIPKLQKYLTLSLRDSVVLDKNRWTHKLGRYFLTRGVFRKIILSDESISMGSMSFWESWGRTPERLADSLARLGEKRRHPIRLKVIVGFRNPSTWMASRYAQSAAGFQNPSQADFEERVADLISSDDSDNGLAWLDRRRVVKALARAVGGHNVFDFTQEELEADPAKIITNLLEFMEFDSKFIESFVGRLDLAVRHNTRKVGQDAWVMRGLDSTIQLTDDMAAKINAALAQNSKP